MDATDLDSMVEDLTGNIDELEESLAPLIQTALSASASKLPLLDKAKLYVLATYAVESVLFSALRLHGVDAKSHSVFQELSRVKAYFAKIKDAETAGAMRSTTLDKNAANRFIKHGLAGNEKFDREKVQRIEKQKAGAKRKLDGMGIGTHTRFEGAVKRIRASEVDEDGADSPDEESSSGVHNSATEGRPFQVELRRPKSKTYDPDQEGSKRQRRLERVIAELSPVETPSTPSRGDNSSQQAFESPSVESGETASAKPSQKALKSSVEALQDLLDGAPAKAERKWNKKRKKSKGQRLEEQIADEMK